MPQTIEQRVEQLEKAHSRLFNQYNTLINDFNKLLEDYTMDNQFSDTRYKVILQQMDKLITHQPKESFKDGNVYTSIIDKIITCNEINWRGKDCINMEVKLVDRDEVYNIFVLKGNKPNIGSSIRFTFNSTDNKLSNLKEL